MRPKRQQTKRPETGGAPPWTAVGICPACGKRIYASKRAARKAAKVKHPSDRMSVYPCRSDSPLRPDPPPWHFGHLAEEIRTGEQDREERYNAPRGPLPKPKECGYSGIGEMGTRFTCSLTPRHVGPHLGRNALGEWVKIGPNRSEGEPINGTEYLRDRARNEA